jgi:hypothetical protein
MRDNQVHIGTKSFVAPLRPAVLDCDVRALDITEIAQPCRIASIREANVDGDAGPRNPITGFAGRWARAANGHKAAAPPSRAMKSRRFMLVPPTSEGIVATLIGTLEGRWQCPLWVKSRHLQCANRCPLYPQKRTCAVQLAMSALGQKRTWAGPRIVERWERSPASFALDDASLSLGCQPSWVA